MAYDPDLDHDEVITAADKDGWRDYRGMPYGTRMLPKRISKPVDRQGYYEMP